VHVAHMVGICVRCPMPRQACTTHRSPVGQPDVVTCDDTDRWGQREGGGAETTDIYDTSITYACVGFDVLNLWGCWHLSGEAALGYIPIPPLLVALISPPPATGSTYPSFRSNTSRVMLSHASIVSIEEIVRR
jgi:hypothetical protein